PAVTTDLRCSTSGRSQSQGCGRRLTLVQVTMQASVTPYTLQTRQAVRTRSSGDSLARLHATERTFSASDPVDPLRSMSRFAGAAELGPGGSADVERPASSPARRR